MAELRLRPPRSPGSIHLPPPPTATTPAVRSVMQGNRGRDTTPEMALRRELHSRGLRYRVHVRPEGSLRCVADVVFRRVRVVVFVDGCYWHGCPEHGRLPSTNSEYWKAKLARNVLRDRRNDRVLANAGWTVVRVWEHEDPVAAADRVEAALAPS